MVTTAVSASRVAEPATVAHPPTRRAAAAPTCRVPNIVTITAAVLGVALGFALQRSDLSPRVILFIYFPGEILLRMLQMLILPLVTASIVSGIVGLRADTCKRMIARTVCYYGGTTMAATVVGLTLVATIKPGNRTGSECVDITRDEDRESLQSVDAFLDLVRNMFPDNLIEAAFQHVYSVETDVIKYRRCSNVNIIPTAYATANITANATASATARATVSATASATANGLKQTTVMLVERDGMNVLGWVVFSIALGSVLLKMGKQGEPLRRIFIALDEAILRLITVVMWYSPVGIFSLTAAKMAEIDNFHTIFKSISFYFLTVCIGLSFHAFITLPLIYFTLTRKNPINMLRSVTEALSFAFGTSSSAATLPVTIKCVETEANIDQRVSRFVLPMGATINMDGTALYEAVAAIFIAQYNNISLTVGRIITISITATFAGIGAAAVPQAGLYTMVIVLAAAGLPRDDISLILVTDWFLDRFRTTVSVMGDVYAAGIVQHFSRQQLAIKESKPSTKKKKTNKKAEKKSKPKKKKTAKGKVPIIVYSDEDADVVHVHSKSITPDIPYLQTVPTPDITQLQATPTHLTPINSPTRLTQSLRVSPTHDIPRLDDRNSPYPQTGLELQSISQHKQVDRRPNLNVDNQLTAVEVPIHMPLHGMKSASQKSVSPTPFPEPFSAFLASGRRPSARRVSHT
ncbi:excitatory amino acid transporter-like [Corticium candelabrum]|uniref:excitatory amino acid transporter-like n=1 Tax=Corticium candelabrum TaxID=121492 RepID=UPI002E254D92|nr:excitatory amino acid transporter-like [Corticium candelabrum]